MSATGQGAAGGDGGQAQGEGQAQQSGGPDLSALTDTLGQLQQGQEEIRGWFEQQRQQAQQSGDPEPDVPDLSFLDQGLNLDPGIDPEAVNRQFADVVSNVADQRAQALIAPLQQQVETMQRDQLAADLVSEFPELATPEAAQRIAGKGGLAEQLAESLGVPQLAGNPLMWRVAHMMDKAAESANGSGSTDPGAASLESGNGASPGAQPQVDLVKQIMEAGGRGNRVLDGM